MKTETQHTPVPWAATEHHPLDGGEVRHYVDLQIKRMGQTISIAYCGTGAEAKANAEFISAACNCHDRLTSLVSRFVRRLSDEAGCVYEPENEDLVVEARNLLKDLKVKAWQ